VVFLGNIDRLLGVSRVYFLKLKVTGQCQGFFQKVGCSHATISPILSLYSIIRKFKCELKQSDYCGVNYSKTVGVGDFCHQGRDTEVDPKISKWSKPIDKTIHWKALDEHFYHAISFHILEI
jgi:hypothetical protein